MIMRLAVSISIAVLASTVLSLAQIKDFRPVTEAMLRNPAPGDWLNWRRTDNAWGYSPLDQINKQNVHQLQLAWSWSMDDTGAQEAAPLVYDGVMYLPNPRGVIQALDAATGDLIWEYRPGATPPPAPSGRGGGEQTDIPRLAQRPASGGGDLGRGIQKTLAIFDDKIFGTTNDAHIVALNARTGTVVWDTKTADDKLGYEYTAGPIVVRGKVIAGITGCGRYKDDVCFISGHDAATGKELWRTSTIARPGEPGGDTWGDLPLTFRAGGDAWITGSYDPATNLVYWGTAQAKPWARAVRGTDGARALHELDARARSGHREDEVVLSAPARRVARHGRSVRERPRRHRRTQVALQDGQARDPVAARSRERRVHPRHRSRLPDARRRRPADRQGDVSCRQGPAGGQSRSTGARAPRGSRAGARWRSVRRPTRCICRSV